MTKFLPYLPLLLSLLPPSSAQTPSPIPPTDPLLTSPGTFNASTASIPAMLRFQCSQLVTERLDPLVNPSLIPSPHLHQIVGGSSFNATLAHDLVAESTCTSCTFLDDLSNYWTAVLFFRARNGTYKRVPQVPGLGLGGKGGITVYYIPPAAKGGKTTAFREGFRMLVGDVGRTTEGEARGDPKVCHRCMPISGENSNLNCAPPDGVALPEGFCPGGIRSVVTFPTCWDGVRLDSVDHRAHMAYPVKGSEEGRFDYDGGVCPGSHPVKVPQVMFEVQWDVSETWVGGGLGCADDDGRRRSSMIGSCGQRMGGSRLFGVRGIGECLWGTRRVWWWLLTRCRHGYSQHGDYV